MSAMLKGTSSFFDPFFSSSRDTGQLTARNTFLWSLPKAINGRVNLFPAVDGQRYVVQHGLPTTSTKGWCRTMKSWLEQSSFVFKVVARRDPTHDKTFPTGSLVKSALVISSH